MTWIRYRPSRLLVALLIAWSGLSLSAKAAPVSPATRLLEPVEMSGAALLAAPVNGAERSRLVRVAEGVEEAPVLAIELFDGVTVVAKRERSFRNRSGSTSWVGSVSGDPHGRVTMVTRDGVTVASITAGGSAYLLHPVGSPEADGDADGDGLAVLRQMDPTSPAFHEDPPTEVRFTAAEHEAARARRIERQEGVMAQDDGSVHDLLVVYTPAARDEAGGTTAVENLIDLGVTETNLSYEASGIAHRLRLAQARLIDYDIFSPGPYGPRDRLQVPDDGHMDEVHPWRDQARADLVMLLMRDGGGCGRAFIMAEVSPAFEAYAFSVVNWRCVSPGYTFQHELGHIQGGRHQWSGDSNDNAPFPFNHGYIDFAAEFRTIMAGNDFNNCPDCTRRLAWSNPDRLDPETGVPMGVPEGEPMACDNRKTLNATAWTVANFRLSAQEVFADGFESGDLGRWSSTVP